MIESLTINNQPLFRPIWDYKRFRELYSGFLRGRHFQFNAAVQAKDYLQVGCGPQPFTDMANLDYIWQRGVDVCWDVTKPLPWADRSLQGIFTEHCLEHISREGCAFALKEFRRILKPGAALRIVVPDGELYLDLYQKAKNGEKVEFPYQTADETTPIVSVNRIFREFTHIFIYDEETLRFMLERAGFVNIKRETFMRGRDAKLLRDTQARAVESLYIEASVPA